MQCREAKALYASYQRVLEILEELPTETIQARIDRVSIWENQDVDHLILLAPRFDWASTTGLVNTLRWLKKQVDEMKAGKNKVGGANSTFSMEEWTTRVLKAKAQVKNLMKNCTKYLDSVDRSSIAR